MYRTVGFEIETSLDPDEIAEPLEDVVRAKDRFQFMDGGEGNDVWNLKSEHCGSEFTSPVLTSSKEDLDYAKDIIESLRRRLRNDQYQDVINRYCGLHVHIGLNDFDLVHLRNLALITYHFETVLLSVQPRSRSRNNYVNRLRETVNPEQITRENNFGNNQPFRDHYLGLSFEGLIGRKACEFRYAASTIRHRKLLNWIKLLLCLVECARSRDQLVDCLQLEQNYPVTIEGLSTFINDHTFIKTKWLEDQRNNIKNWMVERNAELNNARDENE